jgi:hypothetical protein
MHKQRQSAATEMSTVCHGLAFRECWSLVPRIRNCLLISRRGEGQLHLPRSIASKLPASSNRRRSNERIRISSQREQGHVVIRILPGFGARASEQDDAFDGVAVQFIASGAQALQDPPVARAESMECSDRVPISLHRAFAPPLHGLVPALT